MLSKKEMFQYLKYKIETMTGKRNRPYDLIPNSIKPSTTNDIGIGIWWTTEHKKNFQQFWEVSSAFKVCLIVQDSNWHIPLATSLILFSEETTQMLTKMHGTKHWKLRFQSKGTQTIVENICLQACEHESCTAAKSIANKTQAYAVTAWGEKTTENKMTYLSTICFPFQHEEIW